MDLFSERVQNHSIQQEFSIARPQVVFKTIQGGDPVEEILQIRSRARPAAIDIRRALDSRIQRIKNQCANGLDYNGDPFAPYRSLKYIKRKAKHAASPSADPALVNLRYSNNMLDYLRSFVSRDNQGSIGWDDSNLERRGMSHVLGTANLPVRDFLSNTQEELNRIAEEIYQNKLKREE